MGTNYYANYNICESCKRMDQIHIGKSSMGWTFTFHAHPDLGIMSYKALLAFLQDKRAIIVDEYARIMSLDGFKALVASKVNEIRNYAGEYPEDAGMDPDGHAFTLEEFS